VNEALVAVRAIHFASTAMTAGVLVGFAIVADPVLRAAAPEARSTLWTQSLRIAWAGLALTVLSGAAWVLVQTAAMSGRPLAEAVADGVVWIVLSDTQFGGRREHSFDARDRAGDLAGLRRREMLDALRPSDRGDWSRGRGCLDRTRRRHRRSEWRGSPGRRCAASDGGGDLDRRPGSVGALAELGTAARRPARCIDRI